MTTDKRPNLQLEPTRLVRSRVPARAAQLPRWAKNPERQVTERALAYAVLSSRRWTSGHGQSYAAGHLTASHRGGLRCHAAAPPTWRTMGRGRRVYEPETGSRHDPYPTSRSTRLAPVVSSARAGELGRWADKGFSTEHDAHGRRDPECGVAGQSRGPRVFPADLDSERITVGTIPEFCNSRSPAVNCDDELARPNRRGSGHPIW